MGFLTPAAFGLALLLPVIIAMYLLKLRRSEQMVSSVYLWQRMVRDVEANAPWQRLRRNLLLFIQLLFLLALLLALARPFTWSEGAVGQSAIFILDVSASMAATDIAPNRLEAAKGQARQLVNGLPEEARVTIIAAGEGARVLAASSQDRRQALQAIDSLQAGTGGSDLAPALQLAAAIAARQPETEIIVLSDGRVQLPERLALQGRVRYYPIGLSGENQAIGVFSLESTPGGGYSAFVQVANYGERAADRRLEIYTGDRLVSAHDLTIPVGASLPVIAELDPLLLEALPAGQRFVEARLTGSDAGADALALDDRAWAVYRPAQSALITLVTEGNLFLATALGLLPGVEVTAVRPQDWEKGGAEPDGSAAGAAGGDSRPVNTTIFDAFIPITATLPAGNLLFIAPPSSTPYFTVTGSLQEPALRPANLDDPLLVNLSLADVNVLDAVQISLPDWARPVLVGAPAEAGSAERPLLLAGEVDGRRVAVLAFDLHHSDLPLQVAFPLLLSNLMAWLAPGGGGELPSQLAPGAAIELPAPLDLEAVTLTSPDGARTRLATAGGQVVLAETHQLGVYRVDRGEAEPLNFTVNLFAPEESSLKPAGTLPLQGSGAGAAEADQSLARREWWRLLGFLALGLLMAEWLVYQRSTAARLWGSLVGRLAGWQKK